MHSGIYRQCISCLPVARPLHILKRLMCPMQRWLLQRVNNILSLKLGSRRRKCRGHMVRDTCFQSWYIDWHRMPNWCSNCVDDPWFSTSSSAPLHWWGDSLKSKRCLLSLQSYRLVRCVSFVSLSKFNTVILWKVWIITYNNMELTCVLRYTMAILATSFTTRKPHRCECDWSQQLFELAGVRTFVARLSPRPYRPC